MIERLFYAFTDKVEKENLPIEGVAVADGKEILFERHFAPDLPRNIYSHTKSYTATAVGIAIKEGKLSLTDKLADFFPEYVPPNAQKELFEIELRHLLTMSSGFHRSYLMSDDRRAGVGAPDYLAYMFSQRVEVKPGSEFVYSTADSCLAARMVEHATGKHLGEYLYEKLFSKLGQGYPLWEHDPQGHPNGGGGIFMRLSDMLKLGQLYLNNGVWNGEQIVTREWIREATTKRITTTGELDPNNRWDCGYGYQFWMMPTPNAYRADGAYGQITAVFPDQGYVVAVQCPETGDFGKIKDALDQTIFLWE